MITLRHLLAFTVPAGATLQAAAAESRQVLPPAALHGEWFGSTGGRPAACAAGGLLEADGYWVVILAGYDGISMSVQPLARGRVTGETLTQYKVVPPPPGAPASLDIFLHGPKSDVAADVLNGSTVAWVPADAAGNYSAPSLTLYRCSAASFPP
ncbi:MAG: hypothetical protein JNL56_06350 [Alphaproteobacteria bacterium]|nr:hypothetical protein [Alphaproteobacteria bacterium]